MTMPPEVQVLNEKPISKSSITKLKYSPFGSKLAFSSVDTMIGVIKTPMFSNNLEITTLQGHNGAINSLAWSSNDQYLISASADKSVIVWNLNWQKKGEKLLVLDKQIKTKQGQTSSKGPEKGGFTDQVRCAQFYY